MHNRRRYTAHQRSGLVTFFLMQGNALTTRDVAKLTGLTWEGAAYMLEMMSGVLPIYKDGEHWLWLSDSRHGFDGE